MHNPRLHPNTGGRRIAWGTIHDLLFLGNDFLKLLDLLQVWHNGMPVTQYLFARYDGRQGLENEAIAKRDMDYFEGAGALLEMELKTEQKEGAEKDRRELRIELSHRGARPYL